MAKMVPLKRTKADKKAQEKRFTSPGLSEREDHPYGTRLELDHETLGKVHDGALPKTGTKFQMMVHGHVASTEENSANGEKRRRMTLQVTHLPQGLGLGNSGGSVRDDLEDAVDKQK